MIRDRRLCRAARGLVGWAREDLAREAHLSVSTVRAFESGEDVHRNHADAIQRALERAGVEFLPQPDGRMAVRLRANGDGVYEIVRR